ncbi:MAG: glycine/sarcosine/betaine reductase complex component C subunit beta, partial [Chloroflexota bacterium]|nr:glycine/sarcosine/betaine reductase complex component C subunit beta [Chloroflexota bacterium]
VAYPPNRAFLGAIYPDDLAGLAKPWWQTKGDPSSTGRTRRMPHGEMMPEEEFYGLLKINDAFDLVWLEAEFLKSVREALSRHPLITKEELARLGDGHPYSAVEERSADGEKALPLRTRDGRLIGCFFRAHEEDGTLFADVLLENLACKATAVMAAKELLAQDGLDARAVDYVLNTGEEAVGDRYQRGGGNLAKAVAEMTGCLNATGADVKAFCCAPNHAIVIAGALVASGLHKKVMVVGGCSLAKLGMKFQGHLKHDMPILEDVLASVALMVGEDDGVHPVLRLDSVGQHTVAAGSSQQDIFTKLVAEPLERLGMKFADVDKYATELHNPEVTEPAGSGDVPALNYRVIAALAVMKQQLARAELPKFVEVHGMPGFSPTQGHIASAIPFMAHALDRMQSGQLQRALFLAKGILFLGRITLMADGLSFIIEKNPAK